MNKIKIGDQVNLLNIFLWIGLVGIKPHGLLFDKQQPQGYKKFLFLTNSF